jgi:3-deoxy-D-manno-octulosonic-acid transferase
VIVLDTLGELAGLYAVVDAAFIGGSLVARGGQNPLEPVVAGCPVVIGPDSGNFADVVALLRNDRAILQVADADDLLRALQRLLEDPAGARGQAEAARRSLRANSGATARTVRLLEPLLPGPEASSRASGS